MAKVGDSISASNANWSFSGNVHEVFDEHVSKSVPFYKEGHELVMKISDFFLPPDSLVYDLGCSTGTLLARLAQRNTKKNLRFIGIDPEEGMVRKAREACAAYPNISIEQSSLFDLPFEKSNLIIAFLTIMFVHPNNRQTLFNKVYEALNWGGGFIFFEKVRAPDARFQDMMSQIYADFKLEQGYSPEEILGKARSLKGIQEPFSTQANVDLAKRAGFSDIMTVFKYVCFEGFLAIK